jgi:DNA-binding CsgD family transcriptional regulator
MDVRLTTRESAIAALVVAGRTNDEAAAELGLSVKTVEAHLSRVYRKLGVRSRSQLVALLFQSGYSPQSQGRSIT